MNSRLAILRNTIYEYYLPQYCRISPKVYTSSKINNSLVFSLFCGLQYVTGGGAYENNQVLTIYS